MKGLIIRKRWLDKILGDTKSWEMRSQPTLYRGAIALICQGTGGQILGVADLVESLPALTETAFKEARGKHGIPPEDDARVLQDGWVYPWVIRNVRKLGTPVFSGQRPGQFIWVPIAAQVIDELRRTAISSVAIFSREAA